MMKRVPILATDEYANLDLGITTTDEWFARWDEMKKRGDTTFLLSLLFYGLQIQEDSYSGHQYFLDKRLVIHYLQIADGHSNEENFRSASVLPRKKKDTCLGEVAPETVKRKLADMAWQGLCRKVFTFQKESPTLDLPSLVDDVEVAQALLDFFENENAYRWRIDHYNEKAITFLKWFIERSWAFQDILPDNTYELDRSSARKVRGFYRQARPQIIRIIASLNLFNCLGNVRLDQQSKKQLRKLAFRPGSPGGIVPRSLMHAYAGKTGFARERPVSAFPGAAKILLLYSVREKELKQELIEERDRKRAGRREKSEHLRREAKRKLEQANRLYP